MRKALKEMVASIRYAWQHVENWVTPHRHHVQGPTGGLKNFSKSPDNRGGTGGVRKTQF